MRKSILTNDMEHCFLCGTESNIHIHHIFFGSANRKVSERNSFIVPLCYRHHNGSSEGVHFNKTTDKYLKRICQAEYEKNHSREDFIKLIGRNYL